jgi:single-strand DNA-binding protein
MKEIRLLEQNFVMLSGYLARDPDFRVSQKGSALCRFTMGVTRRFKDGATGEWKDDVAWVPVDVWGDAAERLREKLKKGSPVHVEGRLRSRSFEDKSGQKRTVLEVVARRVQFLAKTVAEGASAGSSAPSSDDRAPMELPDEKADSDLEEVPF